MSKGDEARNVGWRQFIKASRSTEASGQCAVMEIISGSAV